MLSLGAGTGRVYPAVGATVFVQWIRWVIWIGRLVEDPEARLTVEVAGDIADISVVLPDRVDRESSLSDQRLGKFASRGECGHFSNRRSRVSRRSSRQASKRSGTATQLIILSRGRERGGRQQEVVGGPESSTAFDPDISGTKPIPKRHHHSDLPGATVNNGPYPDQLAPHR